MESSVLIVNDKNEEIGTCQKVDLHRQGHNYRSCAILFVDSTGNLQLRSQVMQGFGVFKVPRSPVLAGETYSLTVKRLLSEHGVDCAVRPMGLVEIDAGETSKIFTQLYLADMHEQANGYQSVDAVQDKDHIDYISKQLIAWYGKSK